MIYTFADAKAFCADFVNTGKSSTATEVADAINEAIQLLIMEGHWKHTKATMRFRIYNNCLALPENVESVLKVGFDYKPADVWSEAYQFLDGGPGIFINGNNTLGNNLIDMGDGWPTFWPVVGPNGTVPQPILAFSTEEADVGKEIRLRGRAANKEQILPNGPGEVLKIQRWQDGVEGTIDGGNIVPTTNSFLEVTSVIKDVTLGYVTLMAYSASDNQFWILSKYEPHETQPGYRRYRISGSDTATEECITLLVKMRYTPLRHDTDVLMIQNLPALKAMCKSIYHFDYGDPQLGAIHKARAMQLLDRQLTNAGPMSNEIDVRVDGYGEGDRPNLV